MSILRVNREEDIFRPLEDEAQTLERQVQFYSSNAALGPSVHLDGVAALAVPWDLQLRCRAEVYAVSTAVKRHGITCRGKYHNSSEQDGDFFSNCPLRQVFIGTKS